MYTIHRTTLASAISSHIRDREKQEAAHGYTGDSGYLAVLRELLEAIKSSEQISLIGDIDW